MSVYDSDESWGEYDDTPIESTENRLRSGYFEPIGVRKEVDEKNEEICQIDGCEITQVDDTTGDGSHCIFDVENLDEDDLINSCDDVSVSSAPELKD